MLQHARAVYGKPCTEASDEQKKMHLRGERECPKSQLGQQSVPDFDSEKVHERYGHAQGGDDSGRQVQLVDNDRKDSSKDSPKYYGPYLHITSVAMGWVALLSCMSFTARTCSPVVDLSC